MNERRLQQPLRRSAPRLPAGSRWIVRGLATLPLLCLTVSAGVYCASLYRLLHAHLIPIAEAELTRQTGHEVRIGSADFRSGALVLGGIAVSNKATFAAGNGEATLTAKRVTVAYNLHALVFDSGSAAHAIGDVTIEQPTLLVERLSNTRFNFSDFFKPKTKKANKPFDGRILVHDGLLRFRDFDAPDRGKRPALNTLAQVESTVDFRSERYVYFDVRGVGTQGRFASLLVNGNVSRETAGRYRGHIAATDADAAYWSDYFKAFPQARIVRGRADADVTVARLGAKPPPGLPLDLSGRVALRGTTVLVADKKLLRLPLQNLNGTASFTGAGVSLDAGVALGGQPLAISGTVFDFKHPQVAFTVKSPALDPVKLARAVPVLALPAGLDAAPGPVTASFTGTIASPTITLNASLPSVFYLHNRLTHVAASATYAGKVLTVPSATFQLNGTGAGAVRAVLDTTHVKPIILLAGNVSGINLANLHLPPSVNTKNLTLGGLANVRFIADNQNRPLSVAANIQIARPRFQKTALNSLQGRVMWTQGQPVTIVHARLFAAQGAASVSGTVPAGVKNGQWKLAVKTAGLDLSSLLRPYVPVSSQFNAISGQAAFDGKITGPANAPSATGAARLIEPHFGRFSADLVSGNVTAGWNGLRFQDVIVRRFPTEAGLDGSVTDLAGGNPKLALNVRLSEGDVGDFLNLAEQASAPSPKTARALAASLPNLTGTAAGAFHVGGRLKSPSVYGHAVVASMTVGSYRLDQASADVRYANGVLSIGNGLVKSGAATVAAHGSRTASGVIRADFAASGLELTRFYQILDPLADIQGTASFAGSFFGTPQSPHVVVRNLSLPDLRVNAQKFAPLSLAGRYDDGIFTQTGAPWQFTVDVPTDYAAEPGGQVQYQISRLRLTLPTAGHPNRPSALALTAAIPVTAPERLSHVFKTIRQTRWAQTPAGQKFLAQLAKLPQPLSGTFALPSVSVAGPLNALTAQADLSADHLVVGETKVVGVTAHLEYGGGPNPSGLVTASAHDLLAAGVPIGAASLDAALSNRTISLHSLKATSERAFLSASGTANLDGSIAANVDASNLPLALLRSALPSAAPYLRLLPSEVSELSVSASGPTRSPNYVGSVSLANPENVKPGPGSITPPTFALDRIRSGTITLASPTPDAPKVLTVSTLSAFKNGHLVATLSGTLPVSLADLMKPDAVTSSVPDQDDLHADLKVQDLSALAGFSPGLLDAKKTGGHLTASANFGGGRLSGLVALTEASVGLTNFDTYANKINGIVVLADNKATIQSFSGQSSKGGTLTLSGGAALIGGQTVNLRIAAKDLTVDEVSKQNLLYQKFSSGLKAKVNGVVTVAGPWLTPRIATAPNAPLVVSDASGTLPSASNAPVTASEPSAFDPSFALAVQLGSGGSNTVTVSNALLKAEAGGLVQVGGTLSDPQLRADLTVAKGQFTLPPTVLKIVRPATGDANVVSASYPVIGPDGLPGLRTRVDLYAQATVTPSQASLAQYRSVAGNGIGESAPSVANLNPTPFGGTRQRYTITVHIHGILNSASPLALDLTSSPGGLTRQQMLAALVPASALLASGGSDLEAGFQQALVSAALSPLTSTLGDALGLQDLNVAYDPNQPLFVTVTKQIGPHLDVTFSRSFGARGTTETSLQPPQYTVQLGYDLTSRLRLGVSTDDQKNKTVTLETVLRF